MTFEERKKKAIALMADKKMWQSNYAPPILRLFWKVGGKMPPPPFAPLWMNTLFFTTGFAPIWGIIMWFSFWENEGFSISLAVSTTLSSSLSFGLLMALFHRWRKWVNRLPDWRSL